MSGIGSVLGDFGRSIASKLPSRFAPAAEEAVTRTELSANDVVGAKDAYFRVGGAAGEKVRELHMNWQQARAAALTKLDEPVNLAQKQILEHPELRKNGLDIPVKDVYRQAQAINHSIAQPGGALDRVITSTSGNELKSLNRIKNQNVQQARLVASAQVFGPKMENVIPYILPLLKSKDPMQEAWAKGLMNLVSNETHDTVEHFDMGVKHTVSSAKQSVAEAVAAENAAARVQAIAKGIVKKDANGHYDITAIKDDLLRPFDTEATYKHPGKIENNVRGVMAKVQLTMVALKHMSSIGNLASIPAPWHVASMLRMSDPAFKAFRDATNILAYTDHDFMTRSMTGGSGITAGLTGSPTAGQIFFKSYHMPFFDYVRSKQLSYATSVGWTASHNWAKMLMGGSKIAFENLKEMGIDPREVIKQNGVLTSEQLEKGVFHFVNNRFFMDKTIEQSLSANSNMIFRSATMYHTFVNAQQRFLRRELSKMWRSRDYVGLAQFAGTLGVLWPAVAPMVHGLEIFGRTLNPRLAAGATQQDYADLSPTDMPKAAHTYINMLSYYASFGIYTNYIAAAHGSRLAYSVIGPGIGVPLRAGEDTLNMLTRSDSMGKHNAAPFVRDMLEDLVPLAGNVAAHAIAPTAKEEKVGQDVRTPRARRHRESSADKWKF